MPKNIYAFWDDFHEIIIEDYGQTLTPSSTFYITQNNESIKLELVHTFAIGDGEMYQLQTTSELLFGIEYIITADDTEEILLETRNIVRLPAFERRFSYQGNDLGTTYFSDHTNFVVWTPVATELLLCLYEFDAYRIEPFIRDEYGVWRLSIAGDLDCQNYMLLVKVNGSWHATVDPYAIGSTANSGRSVVINTERLAIDNHDASLAPMMSATDAIIYEVHVRDFSIDATMPFQYKGKFLGMIESGLTNNVGASIGFDYLQELGITHVQLLPVYDYGRLDELHPETAYNWGYDPLQYNVPEGSYARNPRNPVSRIAELQLVVATFHQYGIRVNMDVVYNHVFDAGTHAFHLLVPGYFFRYNELNQLIDGTGCGNDVASERSMVRKYIVDSVMHWAQLYGFDGFRFDLMGILDIETMTQVFDAVRALRPNCMVYGEGWNMNTGIEDNKKAMYENAVEIPAIGFFNSQFRDVIKGSTFENEARGLVNGNYTVLAEINNLLIGSIDGPMQFVHPGQSINYVSCHDNMILYDRLLKSSISDGVDLVERYQRLALALVLVSQGVAFIHAGDEFYRSKKGYENTYNLPDDVNEIDWQLRSEHQSSVEYVKGLIALRKLHGAFRMRSRDEINEHIRVTTDELCVYYDLYDVAYAGPYNNIKVVINFDAQDKVVELDESWLCFAHGAWASVQPHPRTSKDIVVDGHSLSIFMK